MNKSEPITDLYCRLSQEDTREGESNRVANQRAILAKYAKDNGFWNNKLFADDGYSGVAFDRPGLLAMMDGVKDGSIKTIIVKDHSRLGRNRLIVGMLLEEDFERYGVRYIAIMDNIDSDKGLSDLVPMRPVQRVIRQEHQPEGAERHAVQRQCRYAAGRQCPVWLSEARTAQSTGLWMNRRRRSCAESARAAWAGKGRRKSLNPLKRSAFQPPTHIGEAVAEARLHGNPGRFQTYWRGRSTSDIR